MFADFGPADLSNNSFIFKSACPEQMVEMETVSRGCTMADVQILMPTCASLQMVNGNFPNYFRH